MSRTVKSKSKKSRVAARTAIERAMEGHGIGLQVIVSGMDRQTRVRMLGPVDSVMSHLTKEEKMVAHELLGLIRQAHRHKVTSGYTDAGGGGGYGDTFNAGLYDLRLKLETIRGQLEPEFVEVMAAFFSEISYDANDRPPSLADIGSRWVKYKDQPARRSAGIVACRAMLWRVRTLLTHYVDRSGKSPIRKIKRPTHVPGVTHLKPRRRQVA